MKGKTMFNWFKNKDSKETSVLNEEIQIYKKWSPSDSAFWYYAYDKDKFCIAASLTEKGVIKNAKKKLVEKNIKEEFVEKIVL